MANAPREWLPHEADAAGSPSTPLHAPSKRIAFGLIGLLISITGALSNALVTANLTNLQGHLRRIQQRNRGCRRSVMGNISINLLLVKFRQQFGLRLFTEAFLVLRHRGVFHILANDLSSAIIVRTAHGMVGAALARWASIIRSGSAGEAPSQSAGDWHHCLTAGDSARAAVLQRAAAAGGVARPLSV